MNEEGFLEVTYTAKRWFLCGIWYLLNSLHDFIQETSWSPGIYGEFLEDQTNLLLFMCFWHLKCWETVNYVVLYEMLKFYKKLEWNNWWPSGWHLIIAVYISKVALFLPGKNLPVDLVIKNVVCHIMLSRRKSWSVSADDMGTKWLEATFFQGAPRSWSEADTGGAAVSSDLVRLCVPFSRLLPSASSSLEWILQQQQQQQQQQQHQQLKLLSESCIESRTFELSLSVLVQ